MFILLRPSIFKYRAIDHRSSNFTLYDRISINIPGSLFCLGFFYGGCAPCYGRLAFIWRIEYIQDLPGAARRLLDSERFEGVPVSSFQERLCTLWQGGKNIWKWVGFCLMKVSCCLLTISSVTESAILGASPRQRFFLAETRKWQLVTLLMPNTKNLCSQNSFGC